MCLAPWVVVPLVGRLPRRLAATRGARLRRWPCCAWAASTPPPTLAAVLPAVLWLLTRRPSRGSLRLDGLGGARRSCWRRCGGWCRCCCSAGTARRSSTTSRSAAPRRLDHVAGRVAARHRRLGGLLPGSGWRAGWLLLHQPVRRPRHASVVAALGLAGLAWRRTPHRLWLVLLPGWSALPRSPSATVATWARLAASGARSLLDGVLAPLRNVHKFDVLIRLPLVLGMAHLVAARAGGDAPASTGASAAPIVVGCRGGRADRRSSADGRAAAGSDRLVSSRCPSTGTRSRDLAGRASRRPGGRCCCRRRTSPTTAGAAPATNRCRPLASSAWEVRNAIPLTPAGARPDAGRGGATASPPVAARRTLRRIWPAAGSATSWSATTSTTRPPTPRRPPSCTRRWPARPGLRVARVVRAADRRGR